MSKKNNVIQFPTHRIKNPVPPVSEELLHELNVHEECIELGRFCIDLIENGLMIKAKEIFLQKMKILVNTHFTIHYGKIIY